MPVIELVRVPLQVGSLGLQFSGVDCATDTRQVSRRKEVSTTAAAAAALQQNRLLILMYGAETSAREQHFQLLTKGRCRPPPSSTPSTTVVLTLLQPAGPLIKEPRHEAAAGSHINRVTVYWALARKSNQDAHSACPVSRTFNQASSAGPVNRQWRLAFCLLFQEKVHARRPADTGRRRRHCQRIAGRPETPSASTTASRAAARTAGCRSAAGIRAASR